MKKKVSESVINRLPRYYRYLDELLKTGVDRISSKSLSEKMGLTASQVRQDFNCFGGFGQQGYGYKVESLKESIGKILGVDKQHSAILIGAGNIGRAFALNITFEKRGFHLVGIFDNDPEKIGQTVGDIVVTDFEEVERFIEENKPEMAIVAIPKAGVNQVVSRLKNAGIKAFLNFTHAEVEDAEDIVVENIHLGDSLMRLSYKMGEKI
ncbi:MAG: redox-sensing transcriptional repressor Rex [Clostridia bacterium]|nr:redox-sensing transcriptional repressor Rex [Clostridia bacterium]